MRRNIWKRRIASLLMAAALLLAGAPCVSFASTRTVRIGYMDIDNFLTLNDIGVPYGYAAEYLNKLAEYTGWEYEYVQSTWADCLQMLESGEIDLLLPAQYTEERAQRFLFSDEYCCMDSVALIGRRDDDSRYYGDLSSLDGIRVGVIAQNALNDELAAYAAKNNFSYTPVFYPGGAALTDALEAGEVDAVLSGNMSYFPQQKLLAKIGYSPAYFITAKQNTALMAELNEALAAIKLENAYYQAYLHEKYYSHIERQAVGFTREEAGYIARAEPLTVMYEPDQFPLEYRGANGEACGIFPDILRLVFAECGLQAVFVANDTTESAWQHVANNEADILLSASNQLSSATQYQLHCTDAFFTSSFDVVTRSDTTLSTSGAFRMAVIGQDAGDISLVNFLYPAAQLVPCASLTACMDAVHNGDADALFANTISLQAVSGDLIDRGLITLISNATTLPVRFGLSPNSSRVLQSVLNKGITRVSPSQINECTVRNLTAQNPKTHFSLAATIRRYPLQSVFIVVGILLVLCTALMLAVSWRMTRRQNRVLQQKNKELQEAVAARVTLQQESQLDPLTGLKHKKAVETLCREALETYGARGCALLIADIDNFKTINDTQGHQQGDAALVQLARQLEATFPGRIIGRIGGDEFLVMLAPCTDETLLRKQLDSLLAAMASTRYAITCSVGVAFTSSDAQAYEAMFAQADKALYEAKNSGKNCVVTAPDA